MYLPIFTSLFTFLIRIEAIVLYDSHNVVHQICVTQYVPPSVYTVNRVLKHGVLVQVRKVKYAA